ncbi:unnamed protein product [Pylaiella littoralis]
MFVKKDIRKIPDILADDNDEREELHLGRRSSEFVSNGIKVVCSSRHTPRLQKLQKLSLYDNMLSGIKGIGTLSATPLKHLNLGRNQLGSLPPELGKVGTLETLWVDDNAITNFPQSVLQLKRLQELRLSGNRISEVPEDIAALSDLRVLALDNNEIKTVPKAIGKLSQLRFLLLRQNELEELPDEVGDLFDLRTLGISSNRLVSLPASLGRAVLLEFLFANCNRLHSLPAELAGLMNLKKANLANNSIFTLPVDVEAAWGRPDASTGKLDPDSVGSPRKVEVVIRGNPVADPKRANGGGSGSGSGSGNSEDTGQAAAAMDETQ